jgi:hypothetical protein
MTLVLGVGSWGLRGHSSDGSSWSYCGAKPTGDDHTPDLLRNVGYGEGVFIAVGGDKNGRVMRTLDGVHWQDDVHPTNACGKESYPNTCLTWMGGVAYLDGVWLAGGGNGATMRSRDAGASWQAVRGGFPEKHIRGMAAGSGLFIASTDGGALYVSGNAGDSWTAKNIWSGASSSAYLHVVHGEGTFIAFAQGACFISSDRAETWQACASSVKASQSFAFDGAQWVASVSPGYATSRDAKTWTAHTASNVPSELQWGGSAWFGWRGDKFYRGATLDSFMPVASARGYRAWIVGSVLPGNVPGPGSVCVDNR